MRVEEIMTPFPACCTPDTPLREIARMMVENDCGEIPIVDDADDMMPIGVVTDRDIVCRAVAPGRNPLEMTASDCMSQPVITIGRGATVEECCAALEANQLRRIPVVEADGSCCGMVAQADIARKARKTLTGELVREVSRPAEAAASSA